MGGVDQSGIILLVHPTKDVLKKVHTKFKFLAFIDIEIFMLKSLVKLSLYGAEVILKKTFFIKFLTFIQFSSIKKTSRLYNFFHR